MKIDSNQLRDLVLQVARDSFGDRTFARRDLLNAAEKEVRRLGFWTREDDLLSASVDPKSRGLAQIDFRFSDLARHHELVSHRRNNWRVAKPIKAE